MHVLGLKVLEGGGNGEPEVKSTNLNELEEKNLLVPNAFIL